MMLNKNRKVKIRRKAKIRKGDLKEKEERRPTIMRKGLMKNEL